MFSLNFMHKMLFYTYKDSELKNIDISRKMSY